MITAAGKINAHYTYVLDKNNLDSHRLFCGLKQLTWTSSAELTTLKAVGNYRHYTLVVIKAEDDTTMAQKIRRPGEKGRSREVSERLLRAGCSNLG